MSTTKKTIACFGATGGCVGKALADALKQDHYCTALARDPQKLRDFLANEHAVPLSVIDKRLKIFQGDVKDRVAVSKSLINPNDENTLVDVILSGVGAYPTVQWSIRRPFPLTDPNICETAIRTIFGALADLSSNSRPDLDSSQPLKRPLLIVISTAGCGKRRGIPLPIYLPYHYLLGSPLMDKQRMEEAVFADYGAHVENFVIIRPLFLTNGEARGDSRLRIGWEWGVEKGDDVAREPGPEIGYRVSRKDVGSWTFRNAVVQGGWEGKCVYLTY